MNLLGYDIGGTKCAVVLGSTESGQVQVLGRQVVATGGRGPDAVLSDMARMAKDLLSQARLSAQDIAGLGISCGGPLDSATGWVLNPPNLPDWNLNLVERVEKDLGIPARLENDANAGAVAEHRWGAGKGSRNMVFLTMGTGMGAGIIINGNLYSGTNDLAGEVGHIRLNAEGPVGYGKHGSFEGFCSGGGIAQAAMMAVKTSKVRSRLSENPAAIDARLVCELARSGDALAQEVICQTGERLGQGLALLMDILNPEIIAIGGVFPRARDIIWPHAEKILTAEALPGTLTVGKVVPASLGESIGDMAALAVALLAAEKAKRPSTEEDATIPVAAKVLIGRITVGHPYLAPVVGDLHRALGLLAQVVANGGRIFTCGNGGSAADACHIVGELCKAFVLPRPLPQQLKDRLPVKIADRLQVGISATALGTNPILATAVSNDQGADLVFAQELLALAKPGDVLIAISTSGKSANVVAALQVAKALNVASIGFTGPDNCPMDDLCSVTLHAPRPGTPAIQEAHLPILHALCLALEETRFGG